MGAGSKNEVILQKISHTLDEESLTGGKGEEMKSLSSMLHPASSHTGGRGLCSQNERAAECEQSVVKIIPWNTIWTNASLVA